MRRFGVFAVAVITAVAAALATGAGTAAAHICPVAAQIPVGRPATIDVGVTVENATVPDVEITVPTGLVLDRVDAVGGWTFTRSGITIRYHGGPITPFTCKYFSIGVTASARGSFGVAVTQRDAAGAVVARSIPDAASASDHLLDQFVYAGVKPPSSSGSKGVSVTLVAGAALVAFGILMVGVLRIRSRRDGSPGDDENDEDKNDEDDADARGAELRERLARFRRRAPD